MKSRTALLAIAGSFALATSASAASLTVSAADDLYNTTVGGFEGTFPIAVNVTGASALTFSVTGSVVLNEYSGNTPNDPDGVGSAPSTSYNSGGNGLAGLTAPNAGFLTGAFVSGSLGTTPAPLDFTVTGTGFASLSPLLQQAFFIGDGLTGDGTGTTQTFYVPTGATTLYLGISDACGYNGAPSCYYDNYGIFSVTVNGAPGAVPEPASWALMLTGFGLVGWTLRQRSTKVRFA